MHESHPKVLKKRPWASLQRNLWRSLWILGGLVLGLSLCIAALPFVAHWAITDQLNKRAKANHIELQWDKLSLGWRGDLHLTKVTAIHPRGLTISIQEIAAHWSWHKLATRQAPDTIVLTAPEITLTPQASTSDAKPSSQTKTSNLDRLMRPLPTQIMVNRGVVHTTLPGPLGKVHLTNLEATTSQASDHWSIAWNAKCVQGCQQSQNLQGTTIFGPQDVKATFTLDQGFTFHQQHDQAQATATIKQASLHLPKPYDLLHLETQNLQTALSFEGWRATGKIQSLRTTWLMKDKTTPQSITLHQPTFAVRRDKAKKTPTDNAPTNASNQQDKLRRALAQIQDTDQWSKPIERAWPWIQKLNIEEATVSLDTGSTKLSLQGLGAQIKDQHLILSLEDEAGRIEAKIKPHDPKPTLVLKNFNIPAWMERLDQPPRWGLGGTLSGEVTLTPALIPPQTPEIKKNMRRGKLRRTPQEGFGVQGTLTLEQGTLFIDGLSEAPITEQGAQLTFEVTYGWASPKIADRLTIPRLSIRLPSRHSSKPVEVILRADLRHVWDAPAPPALWFSLETTHDSCQALTGAIPEAMIPRLHPHLKMRGSMAPELTAWVNLADPYTLDFKLKNLPGTCRITNLGPLSPKKLRSDFRHHVTEGVTRDDIYVGPGTSSFVPLARLPRHVGASAFLTEEISFYRNPGFGISLIKKALRLNLDKGRYVYGGSTVSQQLVKNLYLTRTKTLSRKLEEAFIVWKMEEVLSKDRILELYLNCIEFAPNIYGIGRASQHYFRKPATRLQPLEGAFLAALKPAPWYGDKFLRSGKTPSKGWWRDRLETVMQRLAKDGYISEQQALDADPYVIHFRNKSTMTQEEEIQTPEESTDTPHQAEETLQEEPPPENAPTPTTPKKTKESAKKYRWEDLPETKNP